MSASQLLKTGCLLFALFLSASLAQAASSEDGLELVPMANSCRHTQSEFRCVTYIRNYDGDSVTFDIPSLHPLLGHEIMVRVNGVDTPEMRTKDECERAAAIKAQQEVAKVLLHARRIDLKNLQRGKYFRIVADVIADGINVTELLLKRGLAVPYDGGHKDHVDWCLR